MNADFSYFVALPELSVFPKTDGVQLRCQIVDQPASGPRLSGKYIHLTMTLGQAMLLLAQLQHAQRRLGLSVPDTQVKPIDVPPAKDRN